jgi:hypothetical protein
MVPSSLLQAALAYAAQGWAVFPLQSRGKLPLFSKKKGGRGFEDATTDPEQIRRWWTLHPAANIGIATGAPSRFWALDIDIDPEKGIDGFAAWAVIEAEYGKPPNTIEQNTPRGGRHVLFRWSTAVDIRNSAGRIGRGIDTRGDGGYIVAPPSIHPNGKAYRWKDGLGPDAISLADAPTWLSDLARKKSAAQVSTSTALSGTTRKLDTRERKYADAAYLAIIRELLRATAGGRNDALNKAAFALGQLVGGDLLSRHECEAGLRGAAQQLGLEPREIEATIASGITSGLAEPRSVPGRRGDATSAASVRRAEAARHAGADPETGELREEPPPHPGGAAGGTRRSSRIKRGGEDTGGDPESLPEIRADEGDLRVGGEASIAALLHANKKEPKLFVRGLRLSRIDRDADGGASVVKMNHERICYELAGADNEQEGRCRTGAGRQGLRRLRPGVEITREIPHARGRGIRSALRVGWVA